MNKLVGLTLGISLAAGLLFTGTGCFSKAGNTSGDNPGAQTMPAGQNVTGQDGSLFTQTMPAGENVTPGVDLAAR